MKKNRQWHFILFLVGLIASFMSAFNLWMAYNTSDDFRLFMRIIILVLLLSWTVVYFVRWRRDVTTGEESRH